MRYRIADGVPARSAKMGGYPTPTFDQYLHALRDGRITFDRFLSATTMRWWALSATLYRKWGKDASGVDVADLYQELTLAAWTFVSQWDATRGTTLEQFVVYNAMDKAKKWLHVQRAAKRSGNADGNPSRREVCSDSIKRNVGVIESELTRFDGYREAMSKADEKFGCIIHSLARTNSVTMTAREIYKSKERRREYHLCSLEHAHRVVRSVLKRLAS